ncbi:MAG: sulfite exporter TauE/SafE family protein, partial [Spirochaetales bacterium]|nr:sulfite exporter TauE/SafE family protein [Spirochaetales bacterium]
SSVGAGALGAAVLIFVYPRLSSTKIVGIDIAHAVPLTLLAGLGHLALGSVNLELLVSLLLGSLPGIWLGSLLSPKMPDRVLRPVMAGILALIGCTML